MSTPIPGPQAASTIPVANSTKPSKPSPGTGFYSYSNIKQRLGNTLPLNPRLSETLERIGDTVNATSKVVQKRVDAATREVWESTSALAGTVKAASTQLQDSMDFASRSMQEKVDFVQMRLEIPQLQLGLSDVVVPHIQAFYSETFNVSSHVAYEIGAAEKLDIGSTAQLGQLMKLQSQCGRLAAALKECQASMQPDASQDVPKGRDRSIQRLGVLAITAATTSNDVYEKREQFEAKNHERVVAALEEMRRAKEECLLACERQCALVDAALERNG